MEVEGLNWASLKQQRRLFGVVVINGSLFGDQVYLSTAIKVNRTCVRTRVELPVDGGGCGRLWGR